jgi:large subunit ribosomal protein L1
MKKLGKKYVEASSKIEKNKEYDLAEAISLVKNTSITKFDSSVEVAMHLNIDTKKSDQQLRGSIVLPNGTGKTKRILVLAKGAAATEAKEAGADFVGDDDLIEKISNENWFDYDVIIATPEMMPSLGKIGKVLGPKGLMPNPKTGTVTTTPAKAVADVKKGMIEYRADSLGNVHAGIGKVSFDENALSENLTYFVNSIIKSKPTSVKGNFVKSITICTTMGPSIKVSLNSFDR